MKKQSRNLVDITPSNLITFAPTKQDIAFSHPVFVQCFLPLRKPKGDATTYEVEHGRVSLAIDAGRVIDPNTGQLVRQEIPYGSAARLILAHINNHVVRSSSLDEAQEVPMGDSLRQFFRDYRLKVSGQNGKQIIKQVQNLASARITIGMWQDNQARQVNVPTLADKIDFWLEKNDHQRSLWQPTMTLNREYVQSIKERPVPLDMRCMVGLYEKPRLMDIFSWLSYRLPSIKEKRGVFIPLYGENGLHSIFGKGIKEKRRFKQAFIEALKEIHNWYPEAHIQLEENGIRLFYSPPPIPPSHTIDHGKSFFFGK